MKTILFAIAFLSCFSVLRGQDVGDLFVRKMTDNSIINIDTLTGIKNKKVVFDYDTVYIINQFGISEFVRCIEDLNKVKDLAGPLNSLSGDLSSIQANVDLMFMNTKSLTTFIENYEKETKIRLDSLTADNTRLTKNMESITKELDDARQKIKAEKWKSMSSKALWGAGGFAIGGLLFAGLLLL